MLGSPSITRACVRDWCCTYPVLSPEHRFVFSFPFLIISGHRLGRSFLTSLPQQVVNSDLSSRIPFFPEMSVLHRVILFVKMFYNNVFRPHGLLNNERFLLKKIERVESF